MHVIGNILRIHRFFNDLRKYSNEIKQLNYIITIVLIDVLYVCTELDVCKHVYKKNLKQKPAFAFNI